MNLDDIRRAIAEEEAEIEAIRLRTADAKRALDEGAAVATAMHLARIVAFEAAAETFSHDDSPLHKRHGNARVNDTMNTAIARARGQRLKTKHVAAIRIRAVDGSIGAFASKYKIPATTVRSWYATGETGRKIPAAWATRLEKAPYSIPRTAWRNGIDDGE